MQFNFQLFFDKKIKVKCCFIFILNETCFFDWNMLAGMLSSWWLKKRLKTSKIRYGWDVKRLFVKLIVKLTININTWESVARQMCGFANKMATTIKGYVCIAILRFPHVIFLIVFPPWFDSNTFDNNRLSDFRPDNSSKVIRVPEPTLVSERLTDFHFVSIFKSVNVFFYFDVSFCILKV